MDIVTTVDFDWHQQELAELERRKAQMARMEQAFVSGDTQEFLRVCREIEEEEDESGRSPE